MRRQQQSTGILSYFKHRISDEEYQQQVHMEMNSKQKRARRAYYKNEREQPESDFERPQHHHHQDEPADDEEEVNINDALVAFIEARPVVGQRRSPRLQQSESQRADYGVASLLQEEILQDAVRA